MSSNQTVVSSISEYLATTCMFARGEVLAHGSTRPTRSGQRNQVESETQPTETFMVKPFRDTSNRAILDSRQIVHSCVRRHFLLEEAMSQDQATSSEELLTSAISFKASSGIPSPLQSVAARNGLLGPHQGTAGALVAQPCQCMMAATAKTRARVVAEEGCGSWTLFSTSWRGQPYQAKPHFFFLPPSPRPRELGVKSGPVGNYIFWVGSSLPIASHGPTS